MIRKNTITTANVDKNMGNTTGLLHSLIISNTKNSTAKVILKSSSIVFWIGSIPAKSTTKANLEVMVAENIIVNSSLDDTNVIINIIETT